MSVTGVYLPCLDLGVDCYREHLVELERVISESELQGPIMVLGDFNAHLGGEAVGEENLQGALLQEVLERCSLSAVSQGAMLASLQQNFSSDLVPSASSLLRFWAMAEKQNSTELSSGQSISKEAIQEIAQTVARELLSELKSASTSSKIRLLPQVCSTSRPH